MTKEDKNGNIIYSRNDKEGLNKGLEMWFEYDDEGNNVYQKNSLGYEAWWKYDQTGRKTHYKNTNGAEMWWHYDIKGREVFHETHTGYKMSKVYNKDGKVEFCIEQRPDNKPKEGPEKEWIMLEDVHGPVGGVK